ncbi:OLC1v1025805C1 [Oldenlandia corymbosa var. corymbosa]|uniref:OLC1v1025805C1 n=1 Tax=Oldenlandia corymbosa var. corymbosa TaxID=529605 RepID=A0AAV1C900_OLDCO|nr:OLC1v1025805C1 [Oldenlandia corymbosa var. corymbosa]
MGPNEFAMVEELASLIRDNLPCKHLVLSVEEALVNFLQYDTRADGILELQPMGSYNRLLLHRLADIFGFSHESVGDGDERHLVLERCPETSVPSILVSDLLGQYDDELPIPTVVEVLEKRKQNEPGPVPEIPKFELSLEEREAAYLAARERIFSVGEHTTRELVKPRPHHNPVVARRMIAHALGQKMKPVDDEVGLTNLKELGGQAKIANQNDEELAFKSGINGKHLKALGDKKGSSLGDGESSNSAKKTPLDKIDKSNKLDPYSTERSEIRITKNNFREEHAGAAKRMFVNALGFHPRNGNLPRSGQSK